ncbi:adenosylmethionine decarboxylase [Mitsuaria sp. WAJ17]|uniref:adenosylmethionine decarboxylase n=1 Tax=Mitsuaria sp. WAJ17 TaxID=2761452 RepID=UPI0015FFBE6E|nr:adenosylmethionine decarboxylase [Mitsuaria sp. WAJ17]MBB2484577.1 adenosylmethionine decarboxylase [Mitsuaria sp. WAJ17]
MQGLHLTADLRGCDPAQALMTDPAALRHRCVAAVAEAGLGAVAELFHRFTPAVAGEPSGITGVVLLAESHLAIHTWPELGGVTLDVYVCNYGADNSAKAEHLMDALIAAFAPGEVQCQVLRRGQGASAP